MCVCVCVCVCMCVCELCMQNIKYIYAVRYQQIRSLISLVRYIICTNIIISIILTLILTLILTFRYDSLGFF